ncbi:MAG: S-adenosyl-l-methionine hydroxide adenosyltransferase family protein [Christensenellaceae bacterium]|jgi:S-adenosylmethionine hydrolase|nr:S-adenosyl-l-methionine hydroxide adenosyltransferase family protein [Christensenellaceae bacterium]
MNSILVLQSDFGLEDGAVAAMYGVALEVDPALRLFDLTHGITPYNIWEASYRLFQTVQFWPKKTVFVSVVDPGVGSARKSVVARTDKGQYIVTPDNGTLTHLKLYEGISEVRQIDAPRHMRGGTGESYTFHGRDLYACVGAKLASGAIGFEDVGPALTARDIVELPVGEVLCSAGRVRGSIDILDVRFGSLWTNITKAQFDTLGISFGERLEVRIVRGGTTVYNNRVTYGRSFADVSQSETIIYTNSLYRMALAINQGNFAKAYSVGTGLEWGIEFIKPD